GVRVVVDLPVLHHAQRGLAVALFVRYGLVLPLARLADVLAELVEPLVADLAHPRQRVLPCDLAVIRRLPCPALFVGLRLHGLLERPLRHHFLTDVPALTTCGCLARGSHATIHRSANGGN